MKEGTRSEIMGAVWKLVKVAGAQDKEDGTVVRPVGGFERVSVSKSFKTEFIDHWTKRDCISSAARDGDEVLGAAGSRRHTVHCQVSGQRRELELIHAESTETLISARNALTLR